MSNASAPIHGVWQMIRAEFEGNAAPELLTTKTTLELADGTYSVWFDGVVSDRGSYVIAEGGGMLVLRGTNGTNAGRTIRAIYQQVGDRLRVCYGLDGVAPTTFKAEAGSPRYVATYRRATS
jgi:uncharacterized protein (TIGR03067 family)